MRISKKLLSILLAALMAVSMMPFSAITAFAIADQTGSWGKNSGTNVTYRLTDTNGDGKHDKLIFTGSGEMMNIFTYHNTPWGPTDKGGNGSYDYITEVVVGEGVTSLGQNACCCFHSLTKVTLPSTLTTICQEAFPSCKKLSAIALPSNLTTIGDYAFYDCPALENVTIPANVTSIGKNAFEDCSLLSTVTFERPSAEQNLSLGSNAFKNSPATVAYTGSGADLYNGETLVEENATLSTFNNKTLNWVVPAVTGVAQVGETVYETLEEAIDAVPDGGTITLLTDVVLDDTIIVNDGKKFTIDTNGKTISSTKRVLEIRRGGVTLTGNGTVSTTATSAVAVYGSTDSNDADYATFTLGADTTISAPNGYGAMIGANNKAAYGAKLTLNGTINSAYGVYINGNVQEPADKTNAAQITINGTVTASDENAAVYAAGFAKWTVNEGSTVSGGSGIYIKSGELTVNGGTITATGEQTAYKFNPNGADGTGDAIIIDSCGYPGNVPTVTIKAGSITSTNGAAVASYTKQDDPLYPTADFPRVDNVVPGNSTAVFSSNVSDLAEAGYETTYDEMASGYTVNLKEGVVARVGDRTFNSFEEAWAAAQDGDTITLLADCSGNGLKAPQGKFSPKGLTVDFNGHTYTVDGSLVGSTGTETQAFQLLKDNNITFKNGTIYSEKAKMLVQNYSNLTLDNMTLTLDNPNYRYAYTLSNNNGNVVIDDTTISANPAGGFAFDVCRYASYPSVNVTVTGNSVINGNVEVDAGKGDAKNGFSLTLDSGTMNGDIQYTANAVSALDKTPDKVEITKKANFTQSAPVNYEWTDEDGDGVYTLEKIAADNGYSLVVEDKIAMNAYIAVNSYVDGVDDATVKVTYNNADALDPSKKGTTTETFDYSEVEKDAEGRWILEITQAPAQLADEIKIQVLDENNHVTGEVKTSIADYCIQAAETANEKTAELAKAIYDYGKAAYAESGYVGANNFAHAYFNTTDTDASVAGLEVFNKVDVDDFTFNGLAFVATTTPSLRAYCNYTEAQAVAADLDHLDVSDKTGGVCANLGSVNPEDFDKALSVQINNGASITVNVIKYANVATNSGKADLGRSIRNYFAAARNYWA